jgi:hypothetical protein
MVLCRGLMKAIRVNYFCNFMLEVYASYNLKSNAASQKLKLTFLITVPSEPSIALLWVND